MRKKFFVSIVFFVLALIFLALAIYFGLFEKPMSLDLSDAFCHFLFGTTPSEFFDKEFDFYKETGDFREKSFISEKGNLILVLTPNQQKLWRETEWLTSINNSSSNRFNVEFSADYTVLTVSIPSNLTEEETTQIWNFLDTATAKAQMIQVLNGTPPEKVYIKYIEKNIETGEVLTSYDLTSSSLDFNNK